MEFIAYAEEASDLLSQELGFVVLISIAALVAILIRRIRLPYTVALVLVGLLLSLFPNFLEFSVSSDLILAILVPPLVFEATLHIPWRRLKHDLVPIVLLAAVGTLIGTFIVGGIVQQVLGLSWAAAIAFGALISATDPVAVVAFFRSLGVSKRLTMLMEGESLFNDGVSIVIFGLAIAAGKAGQGTSFPPMAAFLEFLTVAFGGIAVGLFLGYIVSYIVLKNVDDHLIETATTVALAFGSFVVAEEFGIILGLEGVHFSGILAVVAAGLMVGNLGLQNTSPTTKLTLNNFWEFMTFVVNSLVFLLIGLEIEIAQMLPFIGAILVAVVAILLSRAVIIYGMLSLFSWLRPQRAIPIEYRHVMLWGGLRGAISLALALTLTGETFGSDTAVELRVMTFGVVLFTLLVQGTTIEKLIRRLKLADKVPQRIENQRQQAMIYAKRAGRVELERLRDNGWLFRDIWESMDQVYGEEIRSMKDKLRAHLRVYPELEQEMYLQARDDVLKAERSAIVTAVREGLLAEEIQDELLVKLNNRLAAIEILKENRGLGEAKTVDEGVASDE